MKVKYLWALLLALTFFGCDDNTGSLGVDMMPSGDKPHSEIESYKVSSSSILADSAIFARTSTGYLGRYTDPSFGVFEASFMTQFACRDNFELSFSNGISLNRKQLVHYDASGNKLPFGQEGGAPKAQFVYISMSYANTGYFGDSLNSCRLSMYELDKNKPIEEDSIYYTYINPERYANLADGPIAEKAYSVSASSPSSTGRTLAVRLKNNELGNRIIKETETNPEYFKNSDTFIKNVFPGIYVKNTYGDGTILYVDDLMLSVYAECYVDSAGVFPLKRKSPGYKGQDSTLIVAIANFAATKEVVQSNYFSNAGKLKDLLEDEKHTYLKTPAGVFTKVSLPIQEISEKRTKDTINSAKITFNYYNKIDESVNSKYPMPAPEYLLMLREKDLYTFFEKNQLPDNKTSYLIQRNTKGNSYTFSNIASLVTTCISELPEVQMDFESELAKHPEWTTKEKDEWWDKITPWNKVVLVPVTVIKDTNSNIVGIRHDLKLGSAKLIGGHDSLVMEVTYSWFGDR